MWVPGVHPANRGLGSKHGWTVTSRSCRGRHHPALDPSDALSSCRWYPRSKDGRPLLAWASLIISSRSSLSFLIL